jgi:hypothetical protein
LSRYVEFRAERAVGLDELFIKYRAKLEMLIKIRNISILLPVAILAGVGVFAQRLCSAN